MWFSYLSTDFGNATPHLLLIFIGFFNYAANCFAAQEETSKSLDRALKSKNILDRNGAGVVDPLEGGALQQKLPPHVSKFLTELEPADARALLGAFRKSPTR